MYGFEDHIMHEFYNDQAEDIDQLLLLDADDEELSEMGFPSEAVEERHYAAV